MLYQDFKKSFEREEFESEYIVEDARTKNEKKPTVESPKKIGKTSLKRGLLAAMCLIILAASAFLLYVEVFVSGGIKGFFAGLAKGDEEYYYYLYAECSSFDEAKATSDNLRSQGAAGYIYYDGEYKVILSYYGKEEYALSVADKTRYSILKIPKNEVQNLFDGKKKAAFEAVDELVDGLYSLSTSKEKTSNYGEGIAALYTAFDEKTAGFINAGKDIGDIAKMEAIKRILSSLSSSATLADVRYATVAIRMSLG